MGRLGPMDAVLEEAIGVINRGGSDGTSGCYWCGGRCGERVEGVGLTIDVAKVGESSSSVLENSLMVAIEDGVDHLVGVGWVVTVTDKEGASDEI